MKKLTLTIGIPAYNEEANIAKLLRSILRQKGDNYRLEKIIIVSDGSTDSTADKVKKINSKLIYLVANKSRLGLNPSQNIILSKTTTDILVILNADVLPVGTKFLKHLITPFYKNPKLGIVGARIKGVRPNTFVGKILANSSDLKELLAQRINNSNNVYLCHGQARAFSRSFYSKIKWPYNCPEDAYSYFFCVDRGFHFLYEAKATVLFSPSTHLRDHLKQSKRFSSGIKILEKTFTKRKIKESYKIPFLLGLTYVFVFAARQPFLTLGYIFIVLFVFIFVKSGKIDHSKFEIARSSKHVKTKI